MRTLITCSGLGDFCWLVMKLWKHQEKFHVVFPDGEPRRAHQLMDLLPNIIESYEYRPGLNYRKIKNNCATISHNKWGQITEQEFYLQANAHLEAGRRIETFLPDLPTTYRLEYATSEEDKKIAERLLPNNKYIGIYTSAYNNSRHWGGWYAREWMELITLLNRPGYTFVVIGADYDIGVSEQLMNMMSEKGIEFKNTIGKPLSVVVEIMKRLSYFIGFPSGLSILNETLGKDGCMFYPSHKHPKLPGTWADPERIKSGAFKECYFPEPVVLYEWLRDVYGIHYRLNDTVSSIVNKIHERI